MYAKIMNMTKIYKYIQFDLVEQKSKTGVYNCSNIKSGDVLGQVKWHWRQYCYFPSCPAIYSKGCLENIIDFIKRLR